MLFQYNCIENIILSQARETIGEWEARKGLMERMLQGCEHAHLIPAAYTPCILSDWDPKMLNDAQREMVRVGTFSMMDRGQADGTLSGQHTTLLMILLLDNFERAFE